MINYEEIKTMMGNFNPPIVTETVETPAISKHSELYVSKSNRQSLKKLANRINDMKCYSTIVFMRKAVKTGEILARSKSIGHFDYSKVLCGDCSTSIPHVNKTEMIMGKEVEEIVETYTEKIDYPLMMVTPNGAVIPTALVCPKCQVNYMNEIKKI